MDQNSLFSDTIYHETIKVPTDAYFQKNISGKDIMLKNNQSLKNTYELCVTYWSLSEEVSLPLSENFQVLRPLYHLL